ncbi:Uncharacterised protein [uncultured Clostridium sp.]
MNKEKSYKRLSRSELLELLIAESEKNESLQQQLKEAQEKLVDRELKQNNAGSIAEAALSLNGVFTAAEAACAQYIENIERLSVEQERMCARREAESRKKATQIIAEATERAEKIEAATKKRCELIVDRIGGDTEKFRDIIIKLVD